MRPRRCRGPVSPDIGLRAVATDVPSCVAGVFAAPTLAPGGWGYICQVAYMRDRGRELRPRKSPYGATLDDAGAAARNGAMPTMGCASLIAPVEPANTASPKAKIPPSEATSQ